MTVKRIGASNGGDVRLPNEPFELWGRLAVSRQAGKWAYEIERSTQVAEMCFPDEPYDVDDDAIFLGAYEGGSCVGLAVLRRGMFRYLLIDDLKVVRSMRGHGVGSALVEASLGEAKRLGLIGVCAVAQDNNLSACLFYLSQSFEIGGFDDRSYRGTSQQDKADVYFYRDCDRPTSF